MAHRRSYEAWNDAAPPPLAAPNVPLDLLVRAVDGPHASHGGGRHAATSSVAAALAPAPEARGRGAAAASRVGKLELLSQVLALFVPARIAPRLAQALLDRHGTLGAVLAMPVERLALELDCRDTAGFLKVLQAFATELVREPIEERPLIDSPSALNAYLRVSLRHENIECVRLLFLNGSNRVLGEEIHSRGTINHCPLYPREVIRRVIEMNANALVLVHNHPSGDPAPSHQDVEMTKNLASTLGRIGVSLHDHVIAGANFNFSFRQQGLLDAR